MDNIQTRVEQFVHCREVVHSSECPLSEVPLYINRCPCLTCSCLFAHLCSLPIQTFHEFRTTLETQRGVQSCLPEVYILFSHGVVCPD